MNADIQPTLTATYVEKRSRLTTFFRYFMVIPQMVIGFFYGIAVFFTLIAAWLAVSITGKYPEGLYRFNLNMVRWGVNVNGYVLLLTDDFPPLIPGSEDADSYPIQLTVGPRKEQYSRALAFFRLIVGIPVMVIGYAMQIVMGIGAFCAWFVILVTGKQPAGLQEFTQLGYSYVSRAAPYWMLLTERWPTVTEPKEGLLPAAPQTPIGSPDATSHVAAPEAPVKPPQNPFGQ